MKVLLAIPATVWLACGAPAAKALPVVPVMECPSCTETAMRNMAKNTGGTGVKFIYDLPHNVIRKYEVYWDLDCQPEGPGAKSGANDVGGETDIGDDTDCGSFKAADPFPPVDADVQATFNALYHTWQINPALANTGKAERVETPPIDYITGQPFDYSKVAWDYPGGSYFRFRSYVLNALKSKGGANDLVPGLGDEMYGWNFDSFEVGIVLTPGGPGGSASLGWDRNTGLLQLTLCNPNGDCVEFEVHFTQGALSNLDYRGVFGPDDQQYPSQSGAAPGQLLHWEFRLGSDADWFGQNLQHRGIIVGVRNPCAAGSHYALIGARVNGILQSSTWQCVLNQ